MLFLDGMSMFHVAYYNASRARVGDEMTNMYSIRGRRLKLGKSWHQTERWPRA